jgi:plastocyanin
VESPDYFPMKKILLVPLMLVIMSSAPVVISSYVQNASNATSEFHKNVDASPIEGVIMINEDPNKTVFFQPHIITIRVGGEILIANNATSEQSVTSSSGPDDPMSGKFFNTDVIKPKAFVEYVTENLKPGNYSFYSSSHKLRESW